MRRREPLLVAVLVGAYVAAFHRFGLFDFADEGLQLAQAWRVAHGQRPYLDFHTGYGPLYFAWQGALMRWGGLGAVRAALGCAQVASATLVFVLARRLAGRPLAWLAVALHVAFFLPVAPGLGAPFNVPYPAWYAELAGLVIALVLAQPGRIGPAAAGTAGLLVGITCAVKVNSGLLFGAAAVTALALERSAGRASVVGWMSLALAMLGITAMLGAASTTPIGLALLVPIVALMATGMRRGSAGMGSFVALGLGVAAAAAVGLLPLGLTLGPGRFAREVLLIGAGVAEVYGVAPPVGLWLGSAVGLCVAIRALAARRVASAAAIVTLLIVGATAGSEATSLAMAARVATEAMAFAAVGLACWGAVRRIGLAAPSVLVAPTAIAVMGMVQLFPRPDGLHLLSVGPLVLPIGMHLARRAGADLPRPWQRVAIGLCLLLAAARAAPTLWLAGRVVRGDLTMVQLGNERLWATPEGVPRLQAVATAVGVVRERAPANGTVLGFPGCAAVTFFADRPMAGPHDYFFPGRPSRVEVAELIDGWRSRPPPFAVTCSAAGTDLAAAWAAYPEMTAFLAERYTPIATASPFTVHEGHP